MPEIAYRREPRPRAPWRIRIALLLGIAAAAAAFHQRDRMLGLFRPSAPARPREGQVQILVASTRIPAYTRIQPAMVRPVYKDRALVEGRDILLDPRDIIYRVPILDIEAESSFREEMFAPKGTRPGLSAGIPPGWGAVALPMDELEGQLAYMRAGDRVALLAAWDDAGAAAPSGSKILPSRPAAPVGASLPARVTWISRTARVVIPLQERTVRKNFRTASKAGVQPQIFHEITFAMPQEDLVRLAQARNHARIQVLLLSGAEEESSTGRTSPGSEPRQYLPVEIIEGSSRSVHVPRPLPHGDDHASHP